MVTGVSQFLYLVDESFQGKDWHSLLSNLKLVTPDDWSWVPAGGDRSIKDIVQHVGSCKLMYHNHAFGDAQLTWNDPAVEGAALTETIPSAISWLRGAHERLRESIAALDDDELFRPRMTNWGELKETRWIVTTVIQHDLYHAGEINHIRALRQQSDRWAYGG
ncbi:MAG: DinB family protein [Chloroflexota bacterium]